MLSFKVNTQKSFKTPNKWKSFYNFIKVFIKSHYDPTLIENLQKNVPHNHLIYSQIFLLPSGEKISKIRNNKFS